MSLALVFANEDIAPDENPAPLADPSTVQAALSEQETASQHVDSDAADDLIEDQTLLNDVSEKINEQKGEISVESLLFASIITEHASKRLGLKELIKTPALESAKLEDRVEVSTEALDASLEGFWKGVREIFTHMWSSTVNAWRFTRTRASRRERQFKSLLRDLNGAGSKQAHSEIAINIKKLHERGLTPSNFKKYLTDYINLSEYMIFKFEKDAQVCYADFMKTCGDTDLFEPNKVESGLSKIANSLKDPRKRLSPQALKGPLPGGLRFFRDKKLQYAGNSAAARKLDQIAYLNYPARAGFLADGSKSSQSVGTVKALSASDIRSMTNDVLKILGRLDKRELTSMALWDSQSALLPSPAGLIGGGLLALLYGQYYMREGKDRLFFRGKVVPVRPIPGFIKSQFKDEITALKDAHNTLMKMQYYVMVNAAHCFVVVTDGLFHALKAHMKGLQH